MQWLSTEERRELFTRFERDAFHLELKDFYGVVGEAKRFQRWLAGEPETYEEVADWFQDWTEKVRAATQSGKTIRRIRVITEPTTDYIRFEHHDTPHNLAAGEDIRWLPRHDLPKGIAFPHGGKDFWLFDDAWAVFTHFHENGRSKGMEKVTDRAVVQHCVWVRDRLWPMAIPHREYTPA